MNNIIVSNNTYYKIYSNINRNIIMNEKWYETNYVYNNYNLIKKNY